MQTHFTDLPVELAREQAGLFNSLLPLSAMVATPLSGLLLDRLGKRGLFMVSGSFLFMPDYLIMAYSITWRWLPMMLLGTAFSLIPAVMWPSVRMPSMNHVWARRTH